MSDQRGADDLPFVLAAQDGDGKAFAVLFDRWFDRVFDVALRIVRNRDTAAEVAQDVFLVAWQQLSSLEQPGSFGGWLLRTSRNKALNRLDRERRAVALGDEQTTMEIDRQTSVTDAPDPGAALERSETSDLVWAAAEALGERDASVLDLHLRHGLGAPEIAEELGVTTNNAHQLLFRLKAKLGDAVRAFVLWKDGSPACAELSSLLRSASVRHFGPEAVKVIGKHAPACDECDERQRLRLSPEAMFAAVPIIVAGSAAKAHAAAALQAAGVPVSSYAESIDPPDPTPSEGTDGRPPRRARRVLVGAAVAIAVALIALVAVFADPLGHGTATRTEAAATTTSTTVRSSSSTTVPATTDTTAPGATSAPTTAPPATEPPASVVDPGTTVAPTTAPPTTAAPAAPTITSFVATVGAACGTAAPGRTITLSWTTTDATSATIAGPAAPGGAQPANGSVTFCGPTAPSTWLLTATGPVAPNATRTATA